MDTSRRRGVQTRGRYHGRQGSPGGAIACLSGITIALPLLALFWGLFVAADAVFKEMVSPLLHWGNRELLRHALCIGPLSWMSSGLLRQALLAQGWTARAGKRPAALSLGVVEVGVVLGLLNLLFLAFVVVQVRYLFGGAALVTTVTGLTYAEYARRGFFELVVVAAVVLPLLRAAHRSPRAGGDAVGRTVRGR